MRMTCGCEMFDVDWDDRVLGGACGLSSSMECGLINTQDENPRNWKCYDCREVDV